jgi:hypothetical protein
VTAWLKQVTSDTIRESRWFGLKSQFDGASRNIITGKKLLEELNTCGIQDSARVNSHFGARGTILPAY